MVRSYEFMSSVLLLAPSMSNWFSSQPPIHRSFTTGFSLSLSFFPLFYFLFHYLATLPISFHPLISGIDLTHPPKKYTFYSFTISKQNSKEIALRWSFFTISSKLPRLLLAQLPDTLWPYIGIRFPQPEGT